MLSEDDLQQAAQATTQAKQRQRAAKLLENPGLVEKLKRIEPYWRLAVEDDEAKFDTEPSHLNHLSPDLKREISALITQVNDWSEKTDDTERPLEELIDDTDGETADPSLTAEDLVNAAENTNTIKEFFLENPQLLFVLLANKEKLIDRFLKAKERSDFAKKTADGFLKTIDIMHKSGSIFKGALTPLQWLIIAGTSLFAVFGSIANYIDARNNPEYKPNQKKFLKAKSILTLIAGFAGIVAIPLILGVAGSAIIAPALGILMAIYSLTLSVHHFTLLGKGLVALYKEFRKKEPADTYKLRLSKQAFECLHHAANVGFYLATLTAACTGLVALFANPIVLGGLSAAITVIAYAATGLTVLSAGLQYLAEKKIPLIDTAKKTLEKRLKNSRLAQHQHGKKVFSVMAGLHKTHEGFQKDKAENPHHDPVLYLMQEANQHQGLLLKATRRFDAEDYIKIAQKNIEKIETLKSSGNPIYQDVQYKIGKEIGKCRDPYALLLSISTEKGSAKRDELSRYQLDHKTVRISLSENPSDKAFYLLMDSSRDFAPLKMHGCGDMKMVIKVLEAAKLAGVTVHIHETDRQLFEEIKENDPKLYAYFYALKHVKAKEFQDFFKHRLEQEHKKGHAHHLGEILDEIPKKWKPKQRDA
jgi:hypothetical protein